jgi:hypothetical protein
MFVRTESSDLADKIVGFSIQNLASVTLDKSYYAIALYRWFNGGTKSGMFTADFSGTVGKLVDNGVDDIATVTRDSSGWHITNKLNGVISGFAIMGTDI